MKKNILLLSVIVLLFSGCATTYSQRGFFGDGYSDIQINPDSFMITFKGNAYTHFDDVIKYAYLRASELTLQNGYQYFVIVSSEDCTSGYDYTTSETRVYASENLDVKRHGVSKQDSAQAISSSSSGRVVRPGTNLRIKCYKENPSIDDAIDASFYWKANHL